MNNKIRYLAGHKHWQMPKRLTGVSVKFHAHWATAAVDGTQSELRWAGDPCSFAMGAKLELLLPECRKATLAFERQSRAVPAVLFEGSTPIEGSVIILRGAAVLGKAYGSLESLAA